MPRFSRLLLGSFLALGIAHPAASQSQADIDACRQCIINNFTQSCRNIAGSTALGTLTGAIRGPLGALCGMASGFVISCVKESRFADPCKAICDKAHPAIDRLACPSTK